MMPSWVNAKLPPGYPLMILRIRGGVWDIKVVNLRFGWIQDGSINRKKVCRPLDGLMNALLTQLFNVSAKIVQELVQTYVKYEHLYDVSSCYLMLVLINSLRIEGDSNSIGIFPWEYHGWIFISHSLKFISQGYSLMFWLVCLLTFLDGKFFQILFDKLEYFRAILRGHAKLVFFPGLIDLQLSNWVFLAVYILVILLFRFGFLTI